MKIETKILIYSMINNLIIAIIKFIGGIFFGLASLIADGLHTFSDFLTDIICLIGSKISKRKPTKYHPFGFGKVEYLTNLFVGIILLLLGMYIIISSFFKKTVIPSLLILILLGGVFLLKIIAIIIMHIIGKKINSGLLITSVEESKADLYSTLMVFIITIILQFSNTVPILKYSDIIGSIIIGLIVLKTSFKIIVNNSLCLIGETEESDLANGQIKNILDKYDDIKDYDIELIKYGSYYRLQMNLKLDNKLTLRKINNLLKKIKKEIKNNHVLSVKYILIDVSN